MTRLPLLTLLITGLTFSLPAQQTIRPAFDTITLRYDINTPYLLGVAARDTTQPNYFPGVEGNYLMFNDRLTEARAVFERDMTPPAPDSANYARVRDTLSPVPAVEQLLEDAQRHEIVIVNEAHHEPRHRVFMRQLLRGLYDRGYRHFGLETLLNMPDTFMRYDTTAGYPKLGSGYYTRDPQFAAMVDEAYRIGFQLFGYEQAGTGNPRERELGQMRNIMAYRAQHPEGKLLLYVGYSHALEGELGGAWEKSMAQRLADTTGLDPLTISQTTYREMGNPELERTAYRDFAPADEPVLYVDGRGGHLGDDDAERWFDRHVFHPRTTYQYGRSDHVFAHGAIPVRLDLSDLPEPGPYLVQVYGTADDPQKVVPRDVIELDSVEDRRALAVLPGSYQLLVTTTSGQQYSSRITVRQD